MIEYSVKRTWDDPSGRFSRGFKLEHAGPFKTKDEAVDYAKRLRDKRDRYKEAYEKVEAGITLADLPRRASEFALRDLVDHAAHYNDPTSWSGPWQNAEFHIVQREVSNWSPCP